MDVRTQAERLVALGVADLAGMSPGQLMAHAGALPELLEAVLVVHPRCVPVSRLVPLLTRGGKPGFVVVDLTDLDEFEPHTVTVPDSPLYLVRDPDRGDDLRSWSPNEALVEIAARGRRPLTTSEAVSWLLQEPDRLQPHHCFMAIGSRKRAEAGLDPRTPAIWISGGTGRDGRDNRGAPKLGWCWAGNRHTWLGFASASASLPDQAR